MSATMTIVAAPEQVKPRQPPKRSRTWHETDAPYTFANDDVEWERLNGVHRAIKEYLGNRVTLAPIEHLNPKNILELGAGTCVWALDVAHMFPQATVTAVDISFNRVPNPPPNLVMQTQNLLEGFPWGPDSFDIIHMRFLLVHMPNFPELVKKCFTALKPGGIILLEDIDQNLYADDDETPESIKIFYKHYHAFMARSGVDGETGAKLESTLRQIGGFSEIHVHNMPCPLSTPYTDNPKLNRMGLEMRKSLAKAYEGLHVKMAGSGLTEEIYQNMIHDAHDPNQKIYMDFYWTWARKEEHVPSIVDTAYSFWDYIVRTAYWIVGY